MEKLLPQNIEAECGVLGSIIIDPQAIVRVAEFLPAEDFYRDAHRTLYEVALQLYQQHTPADMITLCDELDRRNKLETIGGSSYITDLIDKVPTSGNIEYYGRIVERTAVLRRLIQASGEIAADAYAGDEDALPKAEGHIFKIRQKNSSRSVISHTTALDEYMTNLVEIHDRNGNGALAGIATGFSLLNKKLGGFRRKKLYILAARPGAGKTSMALCFADMAVKNKCNVLFFSLEMDKDELMQRWIGMNARVDTTKLRDAKLSETDSEGKSDWDRVMAADGSLRALPNTLFIDDTPANTDIEMRSKALRMQIEHGIDLIIVDYLQLAKAGVTDRKLENRNLEVGEVARNLKNLAREMDVPILALAQLNRESESRASRLPQLSDLRESGEIEQCCDVAMFIYKAPEIDKEAADYDVDLLLEKNRDGEKGSVPLHFIGSLTKFYPRTSEVQR